MHKLIYQLLIKQTAIILLLTLISGCKTNLTMVDSTNLYKTSPFGFSQAVEANGLLFTSGHVGWDKTYKLTNKGSFEDQVIQSFSNVKTTIEAGNSSMDKIILIRFYVKELNAQKRGIVGQYLKQYYPTIYKPATSLIGVSRLAREELLIEMEAIAKTNSK